MTLLLAGVLGAAAIFSFLLEAIPARRGAYGGLRSFEPAGLRLSISLSSILTASFILSLVSIQLTSWTFYMTGRYLTYYNALVALYYAVVLLLCARAYRFVLYERRILALMLYLVIIPTLLSGSGVRDVLIGIKHTAIPLLLYFFLRISLDSVERLRAFMRLVVFSGAFAAAYVIFELVNRLLGLFPAFWLAPMGFIEENRPAYLPYILDFIYLKSFLARPLGLFLDIYSHGFLMATALFMIWIMGERVLKKGASGVQTLLVVGILCSTVKSYIVMVMAAAALLIFFSSVAGRSFAGMRKRVFQSLLLIGSIVGVFIVFYYRVILHMFGRMLNITVAGSATHEIIFNELVLFFTKKLPYIIANRPVNALFGFGYGTELSLAGESHFLGKQTALMGVVGFLLYWSVFLRCSTESLRAIKGLPEGDGHDFHRRLFLFGSLLCLSFAATLLHYSPLNICNNFIAALILYIGELAYGTNRGLYTEKVGRDG